MDQGMINILRNNFVLHKKPNWLSYDGNNIKAAEQLSVYTGVPAMTIRRNTFIFEWFEHAFGIAELPIDSLELGENRLTGRNEFEELAEKADKIWEEWNKT